MFALTVHDITAYTATVMVQAQAAKYHLDAPVAWSLNNGEQSGQSSTVPVFLEGLAPDTAYQMTIAQETLKFRTQPCAGLVQAADYGVHVESDNNAQAFAAAIAAVPKGGTLMLSQGIYPSGPIFLKSDMTLYIPKGATIAAIGDRDHWPILPAYDNTGLDHFGTWEGLPADSFASALTALACQNLKITGAGILDGGGDRGDWWSWPKETRNGARRPRTIFLGGCTDVMLSGLTVCNSPSWTVHPFKCDRLSASALYIKNPPDSPNTDGFDPESCENVDLRGLRISVGDDCIAVKSGKRGTGDDTRTAHIAPTRHLTITNCLMQDGHGAVVMGSEMSGDITDVTITRCTFTGTDRGLRIKTRRGRGGKVARISMADVAMDNVGTALAANAFYFCDADGKSDAVQSRAPATVDITTPQITDITVDHVTINGVRHALAAFMGLPEAPITGLHLSNITVSYDPTATPGETLMACNLPQARHGGILHRFAQIDTDPALRHMLQDLTDAH